MLIGENIKSLNSILFAINIDNKDLNGQAKTAPTVSHLLKESTQNVTSKLKESTQGVSTLLREITSSSAVSILIKPEQDSDPLPVLSRSLTSDVKVKKDRKKKKKVTTIISFDDDGDTENSHLAVASKAAVSGMESSEEHSDRSSAAMSNFETQFEMNLNDKENADGSWRNQSPCVNGDFGYRKLDVKSIDDEGLDDYDTYEAQAVRKSDVRTESVSASQTPVGSSENPQICCWTPLQVLDDNSEVLFPVNAASSYTHSGSVQCLL
ncbi:unnamed protein product [Ranitomeya imitator]|uniref:Uncharacterized protein n=1 Tax=Ranitomeya imitator TaxID=111125 RepID=A0ABN9MK82_9NEOB|nr:unnamed protein product [Ranitomeya imitator]